MIWYNSVSISKRSRSPHDLPVQAAREGLAPSIRKPRRYERVAWLAPRPGRFIRRERPSNNVWSGGPHGRSVRHNQSCSHWDSIPGPSFSQYGSETHTKFISCL